MSTTISSELNQGYRSALLAYYIGQYAPNSGDTTLSNMIKTPDDVYEYLLIDPLVTNDVQTSRVAQAMSSIQQYINSIALNMEPGYNTQSLDATQLKRWNNGADQYAVWGGYVELDSYPENYIDPTLRQDQTSCFNDLITELNQKTVSNDTAQQAVMGYLNQFEQVANLTIVSGYATDKDQTKGIYYLLGKSTSSPVQYYWRSFDMSLNVDNVVASNAWSEWYPINTSINDALIQGTPRLAYFNNRLYLFWFERAEGNGPNESDTITAYSSQCDFSRNWSSPYLMSTIDNDTANHTSSDDKYCDKLFTAKYLCTACGYNANDNSLLISLYCGDGVNAYTESGYNDFSLAIDYWFNLKKIKAAIEGDASSAPAKFLFNYIENDTIKNNQNKIQSLFLLDKNYISDVSNNSSQYHNDLQKFGNPPVLTESCIQLTTNETDALGMTCSIPKSFNTASLGQMYRQSFTGYFDCAHTETGTLNLDCTMTGDAVVTNINFANTTVATSFSALQFGSCKAYFSQNYRLENGEGNCANECLCYKNLKLSNNAKYDAMFFYTDGTLVIDLENCVFKNNNPVTPSWAFEVYENNTPNCWQASGLQPLLTDTASSFAIDNNRWTVTCSDFTADELAKDTISRYISLGYVCNNGGATARAEYVITIRKDTSIPETPTITSRQDNELGTVVYLSFAGKFSDGSNISPIRLNTLFAKELINKANVSIDDLLTWDTQLTLEPAMTSGASPTPMDFYGANGLYFWELFFYMPWLVASRLSQEGNYANAQKWFNYIRVMSNSLFHF